MRTRPAGTRGVSPGALALGAVAAAFVLAYWRVLVGRRVLLGGNALYAVAPWRTSPGAPAHVDNPLVSDVVTQVLPWQQQVSAAFHHLRLPLWNPYAFGGTPLMGNDVSAAFSPFTLVASLFDPAHGLSLAMLLKLWVAGLGVALLVRALGGRGPAQVVGGLVFATGSYMTVWLGHPQTGVAAVIPWGFAAVEWYVTRRSRRALAGIAVVVALQFFGGHAETSVHFMLALGAYALARALARGNAGWRIVVAMGAAALVGTATAAVQLLPFLEALQASTLTATRASTLRGLEHWPFAYLTSFAFPNAFGQPVLDQRLGRLPGAYPETTSFCGVAALVLAAVGARAWWARNRSAVGALVGMVVVSLAVVYGPLTWIVGRLPVFSVSNNERAIVVTLFAIAVLAALGFDSLVDRVAAARRPSLKTVGGIAALGLLAGCGVLEWLATPTLDSLLPEIHHYIGVWVLVGLLSAGAAGLLVAAAMGGERPAVPALFALVLLEAIMFSVPYTPQLVRGTVPTPSALLTWLHARAGESHVTALYNDLVPEADTAYGLYDARGYDLTFSARVGDFWRLADPTYAELATQTTITSPDNRFMAAAGVKYILTRGDTAWPGTNPVHQGDGMTVGEVPGARPNVFAAPSYRLVGGEAEAGRALASDPSGVVVEAPAGGFPTAACSASDTVCAAAPGAVAVTTHDPEHWRITTATDSAVALVVLQTYSPGWTATVDGREVPLRPADVMFQAVPVPAGRHTVELTYLPRSVTVGLVAGVAGVVGILLILFLPLPRRWRAGPQ